jgi:AhpD family alkylhydroperoxidase
VSRAPTIRDVEWLPPLLTEHRDRARVARIKALAGRVDEGLAYFMASDWVPETNAVLNVQLFTRVDLDHELSDLVGLAVSQDNSCRYCFAATRILLVMAGYPRDRVARLEQNLAIQDLDDKGRAMIAFARKLSRSSPHVSAADVESLRRVGLSGRAYRELAAAVSLWVYFNRISTLAALPPQPMEAAPDHWIARIGRPLIGLYLDRTHHRRGKPVALPAEMRKGPCAGAVNALDGLPVALALRRSIDAMWKSTGIAPRARGLMCATIARALGCPTSQAEATAMLADLGVDAATVNGVLAHLDAPDLSDTERILIRFARETVRYEPAAIQRSAGRLSERLSEREFVEAIGTVSMANMLCRLHMALAVE